MSAAGEQSYDAVFVLMLRVIARDREEARLMALAELALQCERGRLHPLIYVSDEATVHD